MVFGLIFGGLCLIEGVFCLVGLLVGGFLGLIGFF